MKSKEQWTVEILIELRRRPLATTEDAEKLISDFIEQIQKDANAALLT